MNKLFILLALLLILPSIIAAPAIKDISISSGGLTISSNIPISIPQNITRSWEIHVSNETKLLESGVTCNLHIYEDDKTGEHVYQNMSSIFTTDHDMEMITNQSVHWKKGLYSYKVFCNSSNQAGIFEHVYYVTKSGSPPADDIFTLFIYLLFLTALTGLLSTLLIGIAKLATAETTIYDVAVSWSFYILAIVVYYLAQEYLLRTFVETITGQLLTLTVWTNGVLPMISLIISMIIKSTQKKRPIGIKEFGGRFG